MKHLLRHIAHTLWLVLSLAATTQAQTTVPLEPGKTVAGSLAFRQPQSHTIQLQAGQVVRFALRHQGMDLTVRLDDPARKPVAQVQGWSGMEIHQRVNQTTEVLSHRAARSGTYRLTIALTEPLTVALPYQLRVEALAATNASEILRAEKLLEQGQRLIRHPAAQSTRQGLATLKRAQETFRTSNDSFGQMLALKALATAHERLMEFEPGVAVCEQALALARTRGDRREEAVILRTYAKATVKSRGH